MIRVGTPGILWIMASISTNLLAITCSSMVLGEEKRSKPLVGRGVAPVPSDICRAWLTVEIGGADWQVGPVVIGRVCRLGRRDHSLV